MSQPTLEKLKIATQEQLDAIFRLIDTLDEAQFVQPQPLLSGNSLGKHIRHVLELLDELLNGYEIAYVNYDNRIRSLALENSPEKAKSKIIDCSLKLKAITEDRSLALGALCGIGEQDEINLWSSFNRELIYNIEHAVHHMAILQIAIQDSKWVELPADFGLAYSTRKHQMKV